MGFFAGLKEKLAKTRNSFSEKINNVIKNFRKVDEEFFEELEEALILSDLGMQTVDAVMEELRDRVKREKIQDSDGIKTVLVDILAESMDAPPLELACPSVLLIVGVNGVGKTTAIGKLAHYYKEQGKSVMLSAADTFRAAAADQLSIWGERTGTRVIRYGEGADPAAVVYDSVDAAKHADTDVLIIDTAGRLHNKKNLMAELDKIVRVLQKEYPQAQKEVFLVVDATTGQNAIQQAQVFSQAAPVTGVILTKLDGTAKGGAVCAVRQAMGLPVRFIGVGEGLEDLRPFDARGFAEAILE